MEPLSAVFGLIKEKKDSLRYFLYFLPILYLLYISTGVPFSRYFILVLPYLYLSLSKMLFDIAKKVNLSGR